MGGAGSGRYRTYMANMVDDYHAIDLTYLHRHDLLKPGHGFALNWLRRGERVGWIRIATFEDHIILDYKTRPHGEIEWKDVKETVRFDWTNTNFGGRRRWFSCPSCGRRCSKLYGGALFRCRKCYGLQYESQFEPAWQRGVSRLQKIRMKLGGSGSILDFFPEKPKNMHWKTYERLRNQDRAAEDEWCRSMPVWLDGRRRC